MIFIKRSREGYYDVFEDDKFVMSTENQDKVFRYLAEREVVAFNGDKYWGWRG